MKKDAVGIILSALLMSSSLYGNVEHTSESGHLASAHSKNLTYNGGPVVTSVQIVNVLWGPDVNPQIQNSMPTFLSALVTSTWLDGLTEYNTLYKRTPSSNQFIGQGTFVGQYQINPSANGLFVTEADIQAELASQFDQKTLPSPQYDEFGNPNTIYMIEFPPYMIITSNDGSVSCVGFCAFHNIMLYNEQPVLYSVHPDLSSVACSLGCGFGHTTLQSQQSNHSCELAEIITDGEMNAGAIAWYNEKNGEIGDLCKNKTGKVVIDGEKYTVHQLWSNVRGECLSMLPSIPPVENFTGAVLTSGGDITHQLAWDPSPTPYLNGYRILQGGKLVAVIPPEGPYEVTLSNRNPSITYIYRIAAYNDSGIQSVFQSVTLE